MKKEYFQVGDLIRFRSNHMHRPRGAMLVAQVVPDRVPSYIVWQARGGAAQVWDDPGPHELIRLRVGG